jgi:hypothetical protein
MTRRCDNCENWQDLGEGYGVCRGGLPQVGHVREFSVEAVAAATYWPVTASHAHCGHWIGRAPDIAGMIGVTIGFDRKPLNIDVSHAGGFRLTQGKLHAFGDTLEQALGELLRLRGER